jgi:hypothetical protein
VSRTLFPLLLLAGVLLGCDGQSASPEPVGDGGLGGEGGSGGAPAAAPALYVSFVAEVGPGAGPALLRMANDTPGQILSLTLPTGEAFAFYLVEPGQVTDYAPIASADMLEDAILSLHTLDTCIRKPFAELNGPLSLDPGSAYTIRVSGDNGFVGDIVEEAEPEPYVGIRTIIDDRALPTQVGASSLLTLSVEDVGDLALEDVFDELPAPFMALDTETLAVGQIRFRDLAGVEHSAPGPSLSSGVFGYTVYVGPEPVGGAVATPLVP